MGKSTISMTIFNNGKLLVITRGQYIGQYHWTIPAPVSSPLGHVALRLGKEMRAQRKSFAVTEADPWDPWVWGNPRMGCTKRTDEI